MAAPTLPTVPPDEQAVAPAADRRGDRYLVVRGAGGRWSARVHLRAVAVTGVVLAATAAVFCWSLSVGDFPVPLADVVAALAGGGDETSAFIIRTLRLPRGVAAVLVGGAFGLSGAVFQRLAHNPLASPDIIGINAGAAVGAVLVIVVAHGGSGPIAGGALAGALLTAAATYGLAYRRGVTGYRLILVGIGLTSILGSLTAYLLTRARIADARRATVWLTGSLNGRDWDHVRPVALALLVLVPLTAGMARSLRLLELGDEVARGLGARVERARGVLLLAATALAALATAAAGPVGFVALVAPQIARRSVGARSLGLLPAAACGALLMVASDLVGRRLFAPTELPVGVVTAVVGAPYLLFLLARANRIGASG